MKPRILLLALLALCPWCAHPSLADRDDEEDDLVLDVDDADDASRGIGTGHHTTRADGANDGANDRANNRANNVANDGTNDGAWLVGDPVGGRVPAIAAVLEAAYEAAGLDRDPSRSWIRRARIAGLIPWLTVRTGWDASWHDETPDVGRSRTIEVRATWRLDRLLFDGRELQMSSIDTARRRERRRVASHVIQAYFHWRKVTVLAARSPRYSLAAEAATAVLDALTDGWFSDELAHATAKSPR